ncbi:MAG: DUF3868 domain-containing protein, partial [Mediterranea sp.]|nr:DUF3868 domain-containing protein [Mediterranea sp.]
MKRYMILYTLLLFTTFQAMAKDYNLKVDNIRVGKQSDQMIVSFTISHIDLASSYRLLLTPVIYDSTGRLKELKPVMLVGRQRNLYDERSNNQTTGEMMDRHV